MKTKTISLILCVMMFFGLFSACGGGPSVRDDVPVSQLAEAVDSVVNTDDNLVSAPESHVTGFMKMTDSDYEEYTVKINSKGINIDEYGIFRGKDSDQAKSIKKFVEDYIQLRKDTWIAEYMPEEYPKLENAEIKVVGNYVIYVILSDESRSAVFTAFENALKS